MNRHTASSSILTSPYAAGARRGLTLGAYLTVMFLLSMSGQQNAISSLLFLVMLASMPAVIYFWLRSTYRKDRGMTTLSGLWMQGITIFAGGALLSTTVAIGYFRWARPQFVAETVQQIISIYRTEPFSGAGEIASTMQTMLDTGTLPTAKDVALEMFWLTLFCGSILSLLIALIVRAVKVQTANQK